MMTTVPTYETKPDPKRPYKAVGAALLAFIPAALAWWIADEDPFTAKDAGQAFLAGLSAALPSGIGAYAIRNPRVVDFKRG